MTPSSPARLLQIGSIAEQPWANRMGSTRVLAAGPGWRVSLASVVADGSFSVFTSTRRHSVVVDGGAIELTQGDRSVRLAPHAVAAYDGSIPWASRLLGAPATVFNVMCEEGLAEAEVQVAQTIDLARGQGTLFVLPVNCSATCVTRGAAVTVPPGHVYLAEGQASASDLRITRLSSGRSPACLVAARIALLQPA